MKSEFVHLNVHTNYSLLSGAARSEEILARAKELGFDALAMTDTNGLYGAVPFARKAREFGIKPIIGAEIEHPTGRAVCLARNREGYASLCHILSERHLDETFSLAEALIEHQEGLFILSHSPELLLRLSGKIRAGGLFREEWAFAAPLPPIVENLPPVVTNNVHYVSPDQREIHRLLTAIRLNKLLREVKPADLAHREAWFKSAEEMKAAVLAYAWGAEAIANSRRIADECDVEIESKRPIFPKFSVKAMEPPMDADGRRYGGQQVGKPTANPKDVLQKVAEDKNNGVRPHFVISKNADWRRKNEMGSDPIFLREALRKVTEEGLRERYGDKSAEASDETPTPAKQRLDYELDVIDRLGFNEYFLIVWDIVNFARGKGIPIVGRGSAANSLVAYALGITSADPLAHDLYFERFLNLSRTDCPDIDLDICWRRRDEVIAYVYERYGRGNVAMVCNHNTFQPPSAFRDAARVYGLPIEEINELTRMLPHHSAGSITEVMKGIPESRAFPIDREPYRTLVAMAQAIDGFPRHLSVHPGGIVIGEKPLPNYVPLELAAKGVVVAQFEKEAIGLVKIDLLGNRALTVLEDAVAAVNKETQPQMNTDEHRYGDGNGNTGKRQSVRLEEIPDNDAKTGEMLAAGRTIGCFQIESPGVRSLLQMLRAENRRDVIHALSLIRPGPSASGMKERFIRRRLGEEETEYADPRLAEVLGDTYGVMLFQEDILKVAHVVAGFSLEEGDALRKAISKERSPEKVAALAERFMKGAVARGVPAERAVEIWKQIQNFAGYSYCKAHAVTYGYISYRAVYLKTHYPAEFMAAMMSNRCGFYETREYLEEARRLGVKILPPDINLSEISHTGSKGTIRIGLGQVKGLSYRALCSILRAREAPAISGQPSAASSMEKEPVIRPFNSLEDFYYRTQVNDSETERLILCGAMDSFGRARRELIREWRFLSAGIRRSFAEPMTKGLFDDLDDRTAVAEASPVSSFKGEEFSVEDRIRFEQHILDLAVTDHPLRMFTGELSDRQLVTSDQLDRHVGERVAVAGWLVTTRRAVTKNQEYMKFLTLEDRAGTMEVILFPEAYSRFGDRIRTYGPYLIRGKVERNHRAIGITAEWLDTVK